MRALYNIFDLCITEEKTGINLTKESNMLQDQQPPLVEHLNAPSGDVKVVTVTTGSSQHSSYVQRSMPAVSPPLSNSVPTASDTATGTASHDKGKDHNDLMKKREHVIFHLLHGTDSEVSRCQFYETPEECCDNYDHSFASEFEQFLDTGKVPLPSHPTSNKSQPGGTDHMWCYIKSHLEGKRCPSFCGNFLQPPMYAGFTSIQMKGF